MAEIIGKTVTVTVDRPLGSYHPEHKDMYYPVNYGYIRGVMAPDGEEQDAYILGPDKAVTEFTGMMTWKKSGSLHRRVTIIQRKRFGIWYIFRNGIFIRKL